MSNTGSNREIQDSATQEKVPASELTRRFSLEQRTMIAQALIQAEQYSALRARTDARTPDEYDLIIEKYDNKQKAVIAATYGLGELDMFHLITEYVDREL